jgi:hypothetical protein
LQGNRNTKSKAALQTLGHLNDHGGFGTAHASKKGIALSLVDLGEMQK